MNDDYYVWPVTQVLVRVLAGVGLLLCPDCGCVTHSRDELHVHRIFRCRKRGAPRG